MTVMIKSLDMPDNCAECKFSYCISYCVECGLTRERISEEKALSEKLSACPLVEVEE